MPPVRKLQRYVATEYSRRKLNQERQETNPHPIETMDGARGSDVDITAQEDNRMDDGHYRDGPGPDNASETGMIADKVHQDEDISYDLDISDCKFIGEIKIENHEPSPSPVDNGETDEGDGINENLKSELTLWATRNKVTPVALSDLMRVLKKHQSLDTKHLNLQEAGDVKQEPITHCEGCSSDFQRKVMELLDVIQTQMAEITQKLSEIETAMMGCRNRMNQAPVLLEDDEGINMVMDCRWEDLKMKTIEDVLDVEEKLTNEDFKASLIRKLESVGGRSSDQATKHILRKLFSDELASQYSWLGKKEKFAFSYLEISGIILKTVQTQYPGCTEHSVVERIKIWLRNAPARARNGERRVPAV